SISQSEAESLYSSGSVHVPSLPDTLSVIRGLGMRLNIDPKPNEGEEEAYAEALIKDLSPYQGEDWFFVATKHTGVTDALDRLAPWVPCALGI
ncbi:hypothetical protein KIPB_009458, partial [Kipferlia bialata]